MNNVKLTKENIKGIECKYINYAKSKTSNDDLLVVKEVIHTKDGQLIPKIRLIENYQRDFYITKEKYRNHQDKKEYEEIEKCDKYTCTQAALAVQIQRALGKRSPDKKKSLRDVCVNPYVYLADITSPTILKAKYQEKWPDTVSRNKLAVLDIETNVLGGDQDPILITVTMGEHKIVGIVKSYADRILSVKDTIHSKYLKYLSSVDIRNKKGEYVERNIVEERGSNLTIYIDAMPGRLFQRIMLDVHALMPDFLAIWNIDFDIPKLISCLEKEHISLEDVFCDPSIPDKYRTAKYNRVEALKVTNSKVISQHPADLWHTVTCQSGFYIIDAMVLFKKIRTANGNEVNYKLDTILNKYLGVGKLKIKECDGTGDLKWHIKMQKDFPAEYVIYNIFDCISIELLDEVTDDIGMTVSALADISEYKIFTSLPKRLVDILTYFYLENGKVPGSVGSEVVTEVDEDVISMKGWIVTLPAHMVHDNGLKCIEEIPELKTKFRTQTADDDLTQAYPTGGLVMNISKETTHIELLDIMGVDESARRRAGINLTGGATNAIEICNDIMGMPYIHEVLSDFEHDLANNKAGT